jgi:predicted enzyme related to lactoylglutathione lyase
MITATMSEMSSGVAMLLGTSRSRDLIQPETRQPSNREGDVRRSDDKATHQELNHMQHGDFTHIEIPADEPERAKSFYAGLFGWGFQDVPGFERYHLFTTPAGENGVGGAIGKRGETAPSRLRAYIGVDSVDETLRKVTELGGTVIEGKLEVPGQGWYAVITDTEGNEIALWETSQG